MRIYVGFDDTDTIDADRGTGKLARWFEKVLPEGCRLWGVVRQQLLVDPAIPYTSHNSSACAVVECPDSSYFKRLIEAGTEHIETYALPGSDPGLCVATDKDLVVPELIRFGLSCTSRIMTQRDALEAVNGTAHLSGHGGTNDGMIGAVAAVGLTAYGWSGRLIEYGGLRDLPPIISVGMLERAGIGVVSTDRDARVPSSEDVVETSGWLRPRLLAGKPVLMIKEKGQGRWESMGKKHLKEKNAET
jgi:hypothetical protein